MHVFPASYAQQRVWYHWELSPESTLYNMYVAVELDGPLDVDRLEASLGALVAAHEALRTTLASRVEERRIVQIVHAPPAVRLDVIDLCALPAPARLPAALELAQAEYQQRFDLVQGPLWRAFVARLAPQRHVFFFAVHHAVFDQWSLDHFCRGLAAGYRGDAPGRPSLQYADYSEWQRRRIEDGHLDEQLEHWRRTLAAPPPPMELPFGRRRPDVASHRGALLELPLGTELAADLASFARARRTTPYAVGLAALFALLHRYTGRHDLAVGSVVAGRERTELEPIIGYFSNTVVLRVDLSGDPSLAELLEQVQRASLDAQAHQEVPFQRVVEALDPGRSLSHNPLFQVGFDYHREPPDVLAIAGIGNCALRLAEVAAKLDFSVSLVERRDVVFGEIEYATDLFDRAEMTRLWSDYRAILRSVLAEPTRSVGSLELISPEEQRRLLVEWAAGPQPAFDTETLHACFEARVDVSPGAIAIEAHDATLTYEALDALANRIAHRLRRRGIGPGARVGIMLDRSALAIAAVLGVLKSGAAWVPLDARYPRTRLHAVARCTTALLTDDARADDLEVERVDLSELDGEPWSRPAPTAGPRDLAYVIHTSGTTGVPKAVMVEHGSAHNMVMAQAELVGVQPTDRVLAFASASFDASISEVFLALGSGATLCVPTEAGIRDAERVADQLMRERISVATLPPTMLRLLPGPPPTLRVLLAAGEPCPLELVKRWAISTRFWNAYGPTEATVCATMGECFTTDRDAPSIGRPIRGARVYVLDAERQPVPAGFDGELYVGGAGVARGYLDQPELTAQRFFQDPFAAPGARMYRTGDRARFRADGTLVLLGRLDHQIKHLGHRIELEEIEATLATHPAVYAAAAALSGGRLLAFVEVRSSFGEGATATLGQESVELSRILRAFLMDRLPAFAVPAAVVVAMQLPRTVSGKIDRPRLSELEPDRLERPAHGFVAPEGTLQSTIAAIFADVLQIDRVGALDGFFDLGGHSVIATLAVSRIRDALAIELPLRALFEAPTPAGLAERVARSVAERAPATDTIARIPRVPLLLPSFAQQRLWFLESFEGASNYVIPFALHIHGELDVAVVERAIERIAERHEILRAAFPSTDGEPRMQLIERTPQPLPVISVNGGLAEVRARITDDTHFDLSRGPLLRARLFRVAPREHVLAVLMHHIVSDGWSLGVWTRELLELYRAELERRPARLAELTVQYADYAAWQRRTARLDLLDEARARLVPPPPILDLPLDRPRPALQTYRGSIETFEVAPSLLAGLERLKHECGATLFMMLHAAFATLLMRWSGETDVTIGTPVTMRDRRELEPLIGCFVNTLVLRLDLSGEPTFRSLVARAKDVDLDAFARRDLPFEVLVDALKPARSASVNPLFQVMLVFQSAPLDRLELPGLTVEPLHAEHLTSKYDLTLLFDESDRGLSGAVEYNSDLFDRDTIRRAIEQLLTLVQSAVDTPDRPIAELRISSPVERAWILEASVGEPLDVGAGSALDVVERWARETPDALALVTATERLDHGELGRRATQVALQLQHRGVMPEQRVGVCLERSADLVVTLLAIWKCGAAYVPLDRQQPRDRLALFARETSVAQVVTDREGLALGPPTTLISALHAPLDVAFRPPHHDSSRLAYVLFTSGSTGHPKAVEIEHHSVAALLAWATRRFGDQLHRTLAATSIGFDLSVFELFAPLAAGHAVVLANDILGAPVHPAWNEVTLINTVPSAMSELLHLARLPRSLRAINLAGEVLHSELVDRCFAAAPSVAVSNLYGPSETTTYSTEHRCAPGRQPNIGRPIAGERVYVLDAAGALAPVGAVGELYIAGQGVARGYLGMAGAPFVDDPFLGGRMYRTGDRARRRGTGELVFLGRADQQIKLRGFRIELGEIEAVLVTHPAVREAIVVAQTTGGDRRLVAHVVTDHELNGAELRAHLRRALPEYMVPSAFVRSHGFARTPNGKIDRRALAATPTPTDGPVAPMTATEVLVHGIWADVLGSSVPTDANFFDVGGHSLLATKVVARIEQAIGVHVPLAAFFDASTIRAVAEHVDHVILAELDRT